MIRRLVKTQIARRPALAARIAGASSRLVPVAGVGADALREILPDLDERELRAAVRAGRASRLRAHALDLALAVPGARWPYPPVVAGPDPDRLPRPLVLVTMHLTAMHAAGALLERLDRPVLVMQTPGYSQRPGIESVGVAVDEPHRAAALWRGIETLRAGGRVFLALDGLGARPVSATLLGRPVWFARGAFAMSRLTGAPLLPVAPRWRGPRIEIAHGDLVPAGPEEEMAAATARWFDGFLRASPGEISQMTRGMLRARG